MTLQFSSDISDISEILPTPRNGAAKPEKTIRTGIYRDRVKRVLDVVLTLIAAPVVLPLVAMLALLVSLDGQNPFYSQQRIGRNGKVFRMWKLRSMVHNADALLEQHLASNAADREEWDTTQKLKNDPRITFVGRILRKSSMDELPQLWNVLNGTMSLVGPRPMMVCQKSTYYGESYYRLRPGITGAWQVSDRNDCHFVDRVNFDDQYEATLSFGTDLRLLLRTITVVARGTGY